MKRSLNTDWIFTIIISVMFSHHIQTNPNFFPNHEIYFPPSTQPSKNGALIKQPVDLFYSDTRLSYLRSYIFCPNPERTPLYSVSSSALQIHRHQAINACAICVKKVRNELQIKAQIPGKGV